MKILLVQGHPDGGGEHFCHALGSAYAEGARAAGHTLHQIDLGRTEVTFLRSRSDWLEGTPPDWARAAQEAILWADHIVLIFPLWLGGMPAVVKAWLEQVFREGFAMRVGPRGWERMLRHKSARLVVTMGGPAFYYRLYFGAHGTRQIKRSILGFSGVGPVSETLIGSIDRLSEADRAGWLGRLHAMGQVGD